MSSMRGRPSATTRSLITRGILLLAVAACSDTASSPHYEALIAIACVTSAWAATCFGLVFARAHVLGKACCVVPVLVALIILMNAFARACARWWP